MIPDKIYNDDGSLFISSRSYMPSGGGNHPFSGSCVRLDKETETYHIMSPNSGIGPQAFGFGQSFSATSTSRYHTHYRQIFEQFAKSTGIAITEGKFEQQINPKTGQWEDNLLSGKGGIGTYEPWVAWLKEYRTDRCRTGCNTLNGKIVVGEDGEVVYENQSWGRRP
jgi:hypothetical protein